MESAGLCSCGWRFCSSLHSEEHSGSKLQQDYLEPADAVLLLLVSHVVGKWPYYDPLADKYYIYIFDGEGVLDCRHHHLNLLLPRSESHLLFLWVFFYMSGQCALHTRMTYNVFLPEEKIRANYFLLLPHRMSY